MRRRPSHHSQVGGKSHALWKTAGSAPTALSRVAVADPTSTLATSWVQVLAALLTLAVLRQDTRAATTIGKVLRSGTPDAPRHSFRSHGHPRSEPAKVRARSDQPGLRVHRTLLPLPGRRRPVGVTGRSRHRAERWRGRAGGLDSSAGGVTTLRLRGVAEAAERFLSAGPRQIATTNDRTLWGVWKRSRAAPVPASRSLPLRTEKGGSPIQ